MARSLIRSLIERTIGRYVETDMASLDVGLWKGSVALTDLPLKKKIFDDAGLPVVLEQGEFSGEVAKMVSFVKIQHTRIHTHARRSDHESENRCTVASFVYTQCEDPSRWGCGCTPPLRFDVCSKIGLHLSCP